LYAIVRLGDEAVATSGSYRHFRIDSLGNKHPHILDPRTGFPVEHHLVSATVKAKNCVTADGLATTCMVMGEVKARELIEGLPGVEAFFIYDNQGQLNYWQSEGFGAEIVN
jgi:FAD:protein FMN transferase